VDKNVIQPFNPTGFSFNKIKAAEALFIFQHDPSRTVPMLTCSNDESDPIDMVVLTVTPNDKGHVLLVPDLIKNQAQVLTEEALTTLFKFQGASADGTWRTVSACADSYPLLIP
jgi:hypothetical protein